MIKIKDHEKHTKKQSIKISYGIGSWNANKNISIYPVNKYGSINSKISIGINEIAEPIKTILIVDIIGVTLFFEKDEKNKHKEETVTITKLEKINPKKNLHKTSSSDNNNIPLWKTINSPSPRIRLEINKL